MPPPKSDWDVKMTQLDAEIRRLEAEFHMFFAGRLPRPPWETKTRVATLIKKYDNGVIVNTADRFRFESLQSRYQKFSELCDRQLTNRELGRPMLGVKLTASPASPAPAASPVSATRVAERVVSFGRDAADDRVRELYEQLAEAKKQIGETPVEYERVAALVKAQVAKFSEEGTHVAFRIALKDGKVSLTVKAEKSGAAS